MTIDMNRLEAARRLREARNGPSDEAAGWALAINPDSRPTQRLVARRLIDAGDLASADAIITRGLLASPGDAPFSLLRARSLLAQGRLNDARREAQRALRLRPTHRLSILTAAEVELAMERPRQALVLLRYGRGEHPSDPTLRIKLAECLIEVGRPVEARAAVGELDVGSLFAARLAVAEGRRLDAVEILERAMKTSSNPEIVVAWLRALVGAGALRRARIEADALSAHPAPTVRLEVARTLNAAGQAPRAARIALTVSRDSALRNAALDTLAIAATVAGRPRLALRALDRRDGRRASTDRASVAAEWLRAFSGGLLAAQCDPRRAGVDRNERILPNLLERAAFAARMHPEAPASPVLRSDPRTDYAQQCRRALDRSTSVRRAA